MTTTASKAGTASGSNGSAVATAGAPLVLVGAESGLTLIPQPTELTRLNYFDGKFLRADDLSREQQYLRALVAMSNRAGGSGIVHGFDLTDAGSGKLELSSGLAVDPQGRVLWLPYDATVSLAQLIERSRESAASAAKEAGGGAPGFAECEATTVSDTPAGGPVGPTDLYLITISHAEALCGEEDVYGKLCEDACVTSTQRPYRLEGVVVRAVPLSLPPATCTAVWLGGKHRRSQVASAYFADERARLGREMSGARLRNGPWCLGATAETGNSVPVGIVSVSGGALEFLDEWAARRERIEMPPLRYWQWQLAMRPMAVFLAQVLQFQCQLSSVLVGTPSPGGEDDPCAKQYQLLQETRRLLEMIDRRYKDAAASMKERLGRRFEGSESISSYEKEMGDLYRPDFLTKITDLSYEVGATLTQLEQPGLTRLLIEGGIVELPPAGYLPVVPGPVDVNTQVRRLLGDGVDLRFCAVRPDYVPHALEEAQHMDRICLLEGLEDPDARPRVDVLVPDGIPMKVETPADGIGLEVKFEMEFVDLDTDEPEETDGDVISLSGAGRAQLLPNGGGVFHFAGRGTLEEHEDEPVPAQPAEPAPAQPAPTTNPLTGAVMSPEATAEAAPKGDPISYAPKTEGYTVSLFQSKRSKADAYAAENTAATASAEAMSGISGSGYTAEAQKPSAEAMAGIGGAYNQPVDAAAPSGGTYTTTETAPPPPPTNLPPKEATPPNQPAGAAPATPPEPSAWASFRIDGNPFTLQPGDSVPLRGEIALTFEDRGKEQAVEVRFLDAELTCDSGGGGSTAMRGRARGLVMVRARGGDSDDDDTEQQYHTLPVDLVLMPLAGGGGAISVDLRLESVYRVRFTLRWAVSPSIAHLDGEIDWIESFLADLIKEAKGDTAKIADAQRRAKELEAKRPDLRRLEFVKAAFRPSDEVAQSGNPYHDAAVSALAKLEEALEEPGFRAGGEAKLFPPPKKAAGPAPIRATRDWVLFHRRRDSSCDCVCAEPVAPPQRRYRLYHVQAPAGTSVDEIRKAVNGTKDIPGLEIVGVVPQFAPGGATLVTPRRDVVDAWKEVDLGVAQVYGAIAAHGAGSADPAAVLDARLEAVSSITDDVTADPGAVYEVLPAFPPTLSAGGVDGVMILVTRAGEVATQCHRVYALRDMSWERLIGLVEEGAGLEAALSSPGLATVLGSVSFEGETEKVVGGMEDVVNAFAEAYPDGQLAHAVTVTPAGPAQPWSSLQGGAIAKALGGELTDGAMATLESIATGCPVFTVVHGAAAPVETQCHRVYTTGEATMERVLRLIQQGSGLANEIESDFDVLGSVTFEAGSGTVVDGLDALKEAFATKYPSSSMGRAVTVFPGEGNVLDWVKPQGDAITAVLGGTLTEGALGTAEGVVTGCPAFTILRPEWRPPPTYTCHDVYRLPAPMTADEVETVRANVSGGVFFDYFSPTNWLGQAQFEEGTTTLRDEAAVKALWPNAVASYHFAVVREQADEAQMALAAPQTAELVGTLGAGDPSLAFETVRALSTLPGGCDTATLLIEVQPAVPVTEVTCHDVYRLPPMTAQQVEGMREDIEGGNISGRLANAVHLGKAEFVKGTADFTDPAAVAKLWPGATTSFHFSVVGDLATAAEVSLAATQGGKLVEALGIGGGVAYNTLKSPTTVTAPCGTVTLLVPVQDEVPTTETTCVTVYRWPQAMSEDGVRRMWEMVANGTMMEFFSNLQRLGDVPFQAGTATPMVPPDVIENLWPNAKSSNYFAVLLPPAPAGGEAIAEQQATRIVETMKAGDGVDPLPPVRSPWPPPGTSCNTLTLLFPIP